MGAVDEWAVVESAEAAVAEAAEAVVAGLFGDLTNSMMLEPAATI